MAHQKLSSEDIFALEDKYGCRNYAPLQVALTRGEGEFKKYSYLNYRSGLTSPADVLG